MSVIQRFAHGATGFEWGTVASTYLGLFLLGGLFMSMGCCASSMTRSQIVAAIMSFVCGVVLFLLSYRSYVSPLASDWMSQCLRQLSVIEHMQDFVSGVVDSRPILFYLSATCFFLFLTFKVVESRHWK
jgi:ABC-2 type transport system permease protein